MNPPMSPGEYARAVRDALADLPDREREELLEDLDDHLSEVAAESDVPLEDRLGSPIAYAAELRAAYGGRPMAPRRALRARGRIRSAFRTAHARLLGLPPYQQATAFLPELRPAWWVLRGYALALVVLGTLGPDDVVPGNLVAWAFTLMVIWASVWLGRRTVSRGRAPAGASVPVRGPVSGGRRALTWRRALLLGLNAVAAVCVVSGMARASDAGDGDKVSFAYGGPGGPGVPVESVASLDGGGVYNIFPFSADGTPLSDVRLYDQDGKAITTDPEMHGQAIIAPCGGGPIIRNAYPLPLEPEREAFGDGPGPLPEGTPACATPTPFPSPSAFPSATESPSESPSATPTPSASPSPTATPSGGPSPGRTGKKGH
ncbi:HAAS signaling domain-containing protein [Planotetraspora sp. GP83]|uniref:HAAS signaling domain-containing protein n=1 Tax=Planotetraspora sp. GP83 TaxID=3156264 RepID=UPI0035141DB6